MYMKKYKLSLVQKVRCAVGLANLELQKVRCAARQHTLHLIDFYIVIKCKVQLGTWVY
ncbi:hypothetical protein BDGGKGIB_02281 [Nodularia sphaerocarpa UHCC 0038]|nr:hypothetical protein BDGGKGIB_02281 [Nodularia sphaerocarpa UHCC 0038]